MPRLTDTSPGTLADCVPMPALFPHQTLNQIESEMVKGVKHDLVLVCEDGLVATNQCVMATVSSFVRKLLVDSHLVEAGRTGRKEDLVIMHLPEMDYISVNRVVTCFTEGVVRIPLGGGWGDRGLREKLDSAWRVLGIDRVDLEEMFNNASVRSEEAVVSKEDIVVEIENDPLVDFPDKLISLCATGLISIGGERKRKVDDVQDECAAGNDMKNSRDGQSNRKVDDIQDDWTTDMGNNRQAWKPKSSAMIKSVPRKNLKRKIALDSEAFPPTNKYSFDESVDPEPSANFNTSVSEKSNKRGRGVGRPRKDKYFLDTSVPPSTVSIPSPSASVPSPASTVSIPSPSAKDHPSGVQVPTPVPPQPTAAQLKSSVFPPPASFNKPDLDEKKAKIDQTSFALEPFTCFLCQKSKDKDGKHLNMKNLFYMRNHFAKCLYNAGNAFNAVPPGEANTDVDGRPKDEYGLKTGLMYKCIVPGCWLQMKKGTHSQVCYKVYAIHMISQHGVMEKLLEEDDRMEPQRLLKKIRAYENGEVVIDSPKKGVVEKTLVSAQLLIEDEHEDDPDNPALLSEAVQPSKHINVFRKVDTSAGNNKSVYNIFKSSEERVESNLGVPSISEEIISVGNQKFDEPDPKLDERYRLSYDGFHTCFICNGAGKSNLDSHQLSFKNLVKLKEHYARCIYNEGGMYNFIHPGEDNIDSQGKPVDEYGKDSGKMYKCKIQGCWLQRKFGQRSQVCYKVYAIHMASQHGFLETVMEKDARPFMKEILRGIRREEGGQPSLVRCRFEVCKEIQFKADLNKRELKMHYATQHFREWFEGRGRRGMDGMPTMGFTAKGGTRATCEKCTEESKKPIYVQGDNEAIMGHLVVKHDLLVDALREAGDSVEEAKEVVRDLYPDQVTEFYMATLANKQGAVPLNQDFMDKVFI